MCANSAAMNPPPDDDDPFGKRLHPHHRVAGVDAALGVDAVQAVDVQQPRSAAGGDDPRSAVTVTPVPVSRVIGPVNRACSR